MSTERDGSQQKSDKTECHCHFGEVTYGAVDELEFEQRVPGKCLEDSYRPRGERHGCDRELDEREIAGSGATELHQTESSYSGKVLPQELGRQGNSPRKIEIPTGS